MSDCGAIEFLRGGVITQSDINDSRFTNGVINGSQFNNGVITQLDSIDESSTQRIADQMANLPPDLLANLANAIARAMAHAPIADTPATTVKPELPTEVYGKRDALLGTPKNWLTHGEFVIPAYGKSE